MHVSVCVPPCMCVRACASLHVWVSVSLLGRVYLCASSHVCVCVSPCMCVRACSPCLVHKECACKPPSPRYAPRGGERTVIANHHHLWGGGGEEQGQGREEKVGTDTGNNKQDSSRLKFNLVTKHSMVFFDLRAC